MRKVYNDKDWSPKAFIEKLFLTKKKLLAKHSVREFAGETCNKKLLANHVTKKEIFNKFSIFDKAQDENVDQSESENFFAYLSMKENKLKKAKTKMTSKTNARKLIVSLSEMKTA